MQWFHFKGCEELLYHFIWIISTGWQVHLVPWRPPGHTLRPPTPPHTAHTGTHLCQEHAEGSCRSSEPLWRNNPPRCSRARTWTRPGARAPWAAPACCCRAAWPPGAPGAAAAARRRRPAGCGCGACWGSVRARPRCAATSARPGWWSDTCWVRPPETRRRTGAAAAARGGGATWSGGETGGDEGLWGGGTERSLKAKHEEKCAEKDFTFTPEG